MGVRKSYIDNTCKAHLTNSVRRINKDKICLTDIYPKQGTVFLMHIAIKDRTNRRKILFSKIESPLFKGWKKQRNNSGVGILPTIKKTDTVLLGSWNTLFVPHADKLVSLGTNHV